MNHDQPEKCSTDKTSVLKNAVWNVVPSGIGIALLIFATPIYLRVMGEDKFGLYMLLVAVTVPFEILNSGTAQATIKFLAEWLPKSRHTEATAMVRVNLLLNLIIGLIAVGSLYLAAPWLAENAFKIPQDLQPDAIASFRLAGPIWFLMQVSQSLTAPTIAVQNFFLPAVVQSVRLIFLYLGGIVAIKTFQSVASLQLWSLATILAACCFWGGKVGRGLGWLAILPGYDGAAFKKTFGFSIWQMLNALTGSVSQQADRILLGSLLGVASLAPYGIAVGIQQRLVTLVWSAFGSLFPAVSAGSSGTAAQRVFQEAKIFRHGNVISMVGCLGYMLLALFAHDACKLWLGDTPETPLAATLLIWLLLLAIVAAPSGEIFQFMLGRGLMRIAVAGNLAMAIVTIVVSWVSIRRFGVEGAVIGAFAGILLTRPLLHLYIAGLHMESGSSALQRLFRIYSVPFSVLLSGSVAMLWKASWGPQEIPSITHIFVSLSTALILLPGSLWLQKRLMPDFAVWDDIHLCSR